MQVTGEKRFLLMPPSFHRRVHIFPRVHQHHRRSQIHWSSLERHTGSGTARDWALGDELLKADGVLEVTLKAGDMLYLPPYWLHHVTNLDAGISVNVWTERKDEKHLMTQIHREVPDIPPQFFPPPSPNGVRKVYRDIRYLSPFFALYLWLTVAGIHPNFAPEDVAQYFRQHYEQRYQWLEEDTLGIKLNDKSDPLDLASVCRQPLDPELHSAARRSALNAITLLQRARVLMLDGLTVLLDDFIDSTVFDAVNTEHRLMGSFTVAIARCVSLLRN